MKIDLLKLDWNKMQGLLPVIVQEVNTHQILMLGYMNQAALTQTLETQFVTFYSRSKQSLWVKGETSGNRLQFCDLQVDCDGDALLVKAKPQGETCHLGKFSCFDQEASLFNVINNLEMIIKERQYDRPENSYVVTLLKSGIARMAQKVGEEGVEVALAAALEDNQTLCEEVADLLFHVLVLLCAKNITFEEVLMILKNRM